ncbi:MAG: nuclear transport factor 2 family protein [Chloroflexi bacterium]|nr:nuclear transport factor 2 family protein [Chloroflexota bacterium]
MSNIEIITRYFETFFSGTAQHTTVRSWLSDDFHFRGPFMSADSADQYVQQLGSFGDEIEMFAEVRNIVAGQDMVAALVDFRGPSGNITFAQWFTMREGKIARLEVVYDPRSFLAIDGEHDG